MANKRKGRAPRPRRKREKLQEESRDDDSLAGGGSDEDGPTLEDRAEAEEDEEDEEGKAGALVVVGTYDGGLLGFRVADGAQTFGFAPHVGCVKSVHCSGSGKLASGGTDHTVRLFDLGRGTEVGDLQEHDDSVSCLDFWGSSTLVTGGDDGLVCVWRCGDWELLHKFHAHKGGAVACLAIHPSGRLMASAGRDRSLRLWDLTRGTAASHLLVVEAVESLQWSPGGGDSIAALSPCSLRVVNARTGASAVFEAGKRAGLSACLFLSDSELVLGDGKGELRVSSLNGSQTELSMACKLPRGDDEGQGSRSRVKALARGGCATDPRCSLFVVGMSSGLVDIWSVAAAAGGAREKDFTRLRQVDTRARLTCVHLWPGRSAATATPDAAPAAGGTPAAAPAPARREKKRRVKTGSHAA